MRGGVHSAWYLAMLLGGMMVKSGSLMAKAAVQELIASVLMDNRLTDDRT